MFQFASHHAAQLDRIERKLDLLLTKAGLMTATLKDVQDHFATLQQSVAAQTTVDASIETLLEGVVKANADLKAQLLAAPPGDPTVLQQAVDGLTAIQTTVDANTKSLAEAVVANTPAAPTA